MKKIGILTFHRSKNYGAFLQCYALTKTITELCPDFQVEVIDFTRKYVNTSYKKFQVLNCIRHPRFLCSTIKRNRMFKDYLRHLPLSKKRIVANGVEAFIQAYQNEYEAIIVGSDVVWAIDQTHFPMPYWLEGIHAKKLSYSAASHGTDYEYLSQETKDYLSERLKEFMYIGTRDISTQTFVQNLVPDCQVFHNCDPTILLKMEDIPCDTERLKKKLYSLNGFDSNKKTIGVMLSDPYMTKQVLKHFGDENNIVAIYTSNPGLQMNLMDLDIFEWANIFSLFDLTITTFFHGTLFSLKNGTPVISINLKKQDEIYIGKTEDLLTRLGMKECFFHLNSIKHNSSEFVSTAKELLKHKNQDKILQELENEAKSFTSFSVALQQAITHRTTENSTNL